MGWGLSRPRICAYNAPAMNYLRKCTGLLLLLVVTVGCEVTPIYKPTTGGYFGADITPKNTWSARGNLTNPAAAIDENLATAARSNYQYAGAELTIDLKRVCLFQTVIIEHGAARAGHCRSVDISTSIDGKTFSNRNTSPGTRRVTIVSLPKATLARYVRIKAARPGRSRWAIAEVYLQ